MNKLVVPNCVQTRNFHLATRLFLKPKTPSVPWVREGWYVEHHKPMKVPETADQRKLSAAKYGLREGDYKPVPKDYSLGEYPDLDDMNYAMKDPYENWTDPRWRRNFAEPVHQQHYFRNADGFVWTRVEPVRGWPALWDAVKSAILLFAFVFGGLYFGPVLMRKPIKSKQYCYDYDLAYPWSDPRNYPLTHYTFEPDEGNVEQSHH